MGVKGDTIEKTKSKMVPKIIPISYLLVIPSISLETEKTNPKAASPYTNCGCQCSSLTFRDKSGRVQGNCKSADHTGAQWCYVDTSVPSTCQDLSYTSVRFPGKPWSYEACATPACGYNNGGFNNIGYNNGATIMEDTTMVDSVMEDIIMEDLTMEDLVMEEMVDSTMEDSIMEVSTMVDLAMVD